MVSSARILFHFEGTEHWLDENQAADAAAKIMMASSTADTAGGTPISTFVDLPDYHGLCSVDGCQRVDLIQLNVRHGRYVLGLCALYRSTFAGGVTRDGRVDAHCFDRVAGSPHDFANGRSWRSALKLAPGEYIVDVRTKRQSRGSGPLLEQLMLVTSRGNRACFGREDDNLKDGTTRVPIPDTMRRVVAFAGTEVGGALRGLGFFVTRMQWEIVGPLIILRSLVDGQRATVRPARPALSRWTIEQLVLHALVTATDDDIFKYVLSYLAPPCNLSSTEQQEEGYSSSPCSLYTSPDLE